MTPPPPRSEGCPGPQGRGTSLPHLPQPGTSCGDRGPAQGALPWALGARGICAWTHAGLAEVGPSPPTWPKGATCPPSPLSPVTRVTFPSPRRHVTGWGARPAASPSTSASGVGRGEQKALGFGLRWKRELRKRREVKRSPSRDRPNVSVPRLRGMRLREVGSCPWSHSKSGSRDSKPEAPSKDKRLISPRHPRPEHGLWSPPCSPSLKSRAPGRGSRILLPRTRTPEGEGSCLGSAHSGDPAGWWARRGLSPTGANAAGTFPE